MMGLLLWIIAYDDNGGEYHDDYGEYYDYNDYDDYAGFDDHDDYDDYDAIWCYMMILMIMMIMMIYDDFDDYDYGRPVWQANRRQKPGVKQKPVFLSNYLKIILYADRSRNYAMLT